MHGHNSAEIDHVLLAVADLEAGARGLLDEHGLSALPGGRHPGAGTANMLVPLRGVYLELIAVVDAAEAVANPLSRRVSGALARGATFATWAVRVPDLDAVAERLASADVPVLGPRDGSRLRPDGVLLRWRTLHVGEGLEPAVPFFIEWRLPQGQHPGAMKVRHPAGKVGLKRVRLSAKQPQALERRLWGLLGEEVPLEVVDGEREEVVAVVLEAGGREWELR